MKASKATKHMETHVPKTKYGMGDYYGTGIKNPIGRVREDYMMNPIPSKNMGKPPKSLA